jgi:hypothetical protein
MLSTASDAGPAAGRARRQARGHQDYETALKLNPKKTAAEIRDYDTTTAALAALR